MNEIIEPISVKIVREQPKLTLGMSWATTFIGLSFGLFFFWFPPVMIIFLIVSAIFFPVSIIWTVINLVKKTSKSLTAKS